MKRLLLILICAILLFVSCARASYTATDILYKIIEKEENIPSYNIYFDSAESGSESCIDSDKEDLLYNGMSPFDLCSSYAILLSKDDRAYELHVFECDSELHVPQVMKILRRRIDMLQDNDVYLYDDENYEKVVSAARIVSRRRYVFLLVTDNNNGIEDLIKDVL